MASKSNPDVSDVESGASYSMLMAQEIRRLVGPDKKISFVSGNFNVVHPGHLRILKFAAESADFLVVGLNPDEADGVTVTADMRLEAIEALSITDYAVLLEGGSDDFIKILQPDFVVKGKEHEGLGNIEAAAVETYGGRVLFCSGEMRFSSISLLKRDYSEANLSNIRKARHYPARHGFEVVDLKRCLNAFAGLKVLVIGDLIVDRYVDCDPLGMSQEDPTIVVTPIASTTFVGGAGIVAAHAQSLGADVSYFTVIGDDVEGRDARQRLADYDVKTLMLIDETRPTTLKQRFRAHGKTLLRVNQLRQHALNKAIMDEMIDAVMGQIDQADLILFSDFNYGCLPQPLVDRISEEASRRNIMMAADSQASSQMADISRFRNMDLISPTEREARLATHDTAAGLAVLASTLQMKANAKNVVVTLGAEGVLVHGNSGQEFVTDRLPAFNLSPKDVAGGGDSFFTTAALAMASGTDIWRSAYIGALAAGCQVSTVGNSPLKLRTLFEEIDLPDHFDAE
ncbi:MAG: adenylyltransferase/cytidyltransferase family protein [Phycisphaerales bacterium]|nr:adenylyltransferase/cytidyltransferase family protein [Phycisphaerales bacterium]